MKKYMIYALMLAASFAYSDTIIMPPGITLADAESLVTSATTNAAQIADFSAVVGNPTNSYLVVNGFTLAFDSVIINGGFSYKNYSATYEATYDDLGSWMESDGKRHWVVTWANGETLLGYHPTSTGYLPPYDGYLDTDGNPVALIVEWFPGVAPAVTDAITAATNNLATIEGGSIVVSNNAFYFYVD